MKPTDHPLEQIDPSLAILLHRIACDWNPLPLPPRSAISVQWGNALLSGRSVRLDGARLEIEVTAPATVTDSGAVPFSELRGQAAEGECSDGTTFRAEEAVVSRWDSAGSVWLSSIAWTLANPAKPAAVWVCRLTNAELEGLGNMLLSAPFHGSWGHYCFRGARYRYFLLRRRVPREELLLVIDCAGDATPELETLYREIPALGLAVGQPLHAPVLHGIDMDGSSVAITGGDFGWATTGDVIGHPLAPNMQREPWIVPFFEAIAQYLSKFESPRDYANFRLCSWYYLDSLADRSAEGVQLKTLVSLASAARHIVGTSKSTSMPVAWSEWVASHADEIRKVGAGDCGEILMRRLESVGDPRPAELIHAAASKCGVRLTSEMLSALDVAQSGLTGASLPIGGLDAVVPHLRSLLAALIARIVNYQGPISGWERVRNFYFYGPAPEDWWASHKDAAPITRYHAEAEHEPGRIRDLWPMFKRPSLPQEGAVAKIATFADGLASRTNGAVIASVVPVPSEADGPGGVFNFVLRVSRRPSIQTVLFSISASAQKVEIHGWKGPADMESEDQIVSFLTEVASSPGTRVRVQQLLLAAEGLLDD